MSRDSSAISNLYERRLPVLRALAGNLEKQLTDDLSSLPHIDRISFRTKSVASFVSKAEGLGNDGKPKYAHALEEIEDQVAGRVLVFFRPDIAAVLGVIENRWPKAEQTHRRPPATSQFDYETTHRICVITPDMKPTGWADLEDPPTTFELQIRTLAQHAWSEPQHAIYKNKGGLTEASERKLYWAAASAWGMDSIWQDLQQELAGIENGPRRT